ncbi:MAG TPA: ATP-grasp domain-containing protein [Thermodesulfobacteriota bacterium]|nr:ATP-grasp domain-containing protein [Thermodesulfobacteriota bacterium]
MTVRSVRIVYNDDFSEGVHDTYELDGKPIKLDNNIADTVKEVEASLRKEGFSTGLIPLRPGKRDCLEDFIAKIRPAVGPDCLVFNLCEEAFGKSSFEMHIAALLELLGIRFTGSGPLTLGLALNKGLTKDILYSSDLMTPEYCVMKEPPTRLKRSLKFPLIVKPLKEDASIGIDSEAVVRTMKELKKRVEFIIHEFNQPAIVEEYVEGREFNIAVLGNGAGVRALPPSEIDFVDFPDGKPKICCYEAKWVPESPFYKKTVPVCPANVPDSLAEELQAVALKAYQAMGCRDYARVDVRVGEDGNIKVLEVNPNPDISSDAGLARAGAAIGLDYSKLMTEIVRIAAERYETAEAKKPARPAPAM